MQLIAVGEQNLWINGENPEVTFWKSGWKTHTNFATASQEVNFMTQIGFGKTLIAQIPRNGDLVFTTTAIFEIPGIRVSQEYLAVLAETNSSQQPVYTVPAPAEQQPGDAGASAYDLMKNPFGFTRQSQFFGNRRDLYKTNCAQDNALAADALNDIYATFTNSLGHVLIEELQIMIGGVCSEKTTGRYMDILEEYGSRPGAKLGEMIGKFDTLPELIEFWNVATRQLFVPLDVWFTKIPGQAFPYLGLHFHELKVQMKIAPLSKLMINSDPAYNGRIYERVDGAGALTQNDLNASLMVEYVYLEGAERRRFANIDNKYLYHQMQDQNTDLPITSNVNQTNGTKQQFKLELSHPTVCLFIVCQQNFAADKNQHYNYAGDQGLDPIDKIRFVLNSQDRFSERSARWFRTHEPWRTGCNIPKNYIYMIPFGLHPMHPTQPAGALNMSKIESIVLYLTFQRGLADATLHIYGRSWNIFKIKGGMAGPVYAA